jgi:hypothetical protein
MAWLGKDKRMKKLGMLLVLFGLGGIFGCAQEAPAPKPADAKAPPAATAPTADAPKPEATKADAPKADTSKAPPAPASTEKK